MCVPMPSIVTHPAARGPHSLLAHPPARVLAHPSKVKTMWGVGVLQQLRDRNAALKPFESLVLGCTCKCALCAAVDVTCRDG